MKLETVTNWKEKLTLIILNIKLIFLGGYFLRLVGYTFIVGSIYICFYGVTFNSGDIGLGDIQLNVIFLSSVEGICYFGTVPFISKTRRKMATFWC